MYVFQYAADLRRYLGSARHTSVGFVPTMGALHAGHISLISRAAAAGDLTTACIFVNPTQFNDPEDLRKYPRTPESDISMLAKAGCSAVLMPSVEEVYPPNGDRTYQFEFGHLEMVMEGAFRPGHFQGVAQVVARLLDLVQPERLYMGQKDFQQTAIVAEMLRQLHSTTQLIVVETVREPDGLAMSSRNVRLSPEHRAAAPVIYQCLLDAKRLYPELEAAAISERAIQKMENAGLRPEYFEIVDGRTLLAVEQPRRADFVVACVAAWAGDVRLIDNVVLRSPV
jgi:pantoate--beta-alanine ligase